MSIDEKSMKQRKMMWTLKIQKMGIVPINSIALSVKCISWSVSFAYGK